MKALGLCLLMTAILVSCQEEGNQNDPNADFIKRNSSNNLSISDNRVTDGDSDEPTHAPIDGGLGVLLVAGVAYGSKQLFKKKSSAA